MSDTTSPKTQTLPILSASTPSKSPPATTPPSVAYLGPPTSYTHQATLASFPEPTYTLEPRPNIIDVFRAVSSSSTSYGVIPFENSSNGAVLQTLDIFTPSPSPSPPSPRFPNLTVCGEIYLPIAHNLVGHMPDAARNARSLDERTVHVKTIYSHPQAFGQCEAFLSMYLRGVERREVSSTSRAAEIAAADGEGASAAISSRMAAEASGLEVLAGRVEDREDNETRFVVLRRVGDGEGEGLPGMFNGGGSGDGEGWRTFVGLAIDHGRTGALGEVLGVFAGCGLNLTSINSRPSRTSPWHYTFFVEFGGRKEGDGSGDVNKALEQLKGVTEWCTWHGSWRKRGGI